MRVVNRKAFLALPEGTIYAKGEPWAFSGILVKGESLETDWTCLDPVGIFAHDSGEECARLDEMLEHGASYPMQDAYWRDGCFNCEEVFLIFEKADLAILRGYIDAAISVADS